LINGRRGRRGRRRRGRGRRRKRRGKEKIYPRSFLKILFCHKLPFFSISWRA
jgi:hypothetical protein